MMMISEVLTTLVLLDLDPAVLSLSNLSFLHASIEEKIEEYQETTRNKMDENDSEPKR